MAAEPEFPGEEAFTHELKTAADIQARLIPKEIPRIDGYDIAAYYRPCKTVSGDYFDFLKLDEKRYGMVVADVSGKGLSAGFIMAQVHTFLHNNPQVLGSPALSAVSLNDYLRKNLPHGMFVTMVYCVLHVPSGQIALVNCGHNPVLWHQSITGDIRETSEQGMALGIASRSIFQENLHESKIRLSRDDCLLVYTDGVTEATNPEGEEFRVDRLRALLRQHGAKPVQQLLTHVVRELYAFTTTTHLPDDITMLGVRRTGSPTSLMPAVKGASDRLLPIPEAAKKTGLSEDTIRVAIREGRLRSKFVENVWDHMVVEEDVLRLAGRMGEASAARPRVLLVAPNSQFADILALELRRRKDAEFKQANLSFDAVRAAQAFDPGIIIFEFSGVDDRVTQILSELKKACPVAEFMVYMENPEIVLARPQVSNLFRLLNVRHTFDQRKGSRPILMLLSSRIKGDPTA